MAGELTVVDLDFDKIKDNLKTFLKNQSYLTDYDFEGSALSILMDMLAYDTHYKAYLANMVINERFIDTAVKRSSVISHAKTLGYVPRSVSAARATVNVTVYGISQDYTMAIDKYTPFSCAINGTDYTFVTTKSYVTIPSGEYNAYTFNDVQLYEGTPLTYNYVVPSSEVGQLFKIPAANVDTTTLTIVVQTSATDTSSSVYTYADSISLLNSNSKVYYIEEGTDGFFYVYFGDNILGKGIEAGNIIKMSYVVSSGDFANTSSMYAQVFSLTGSINGYSSSNVVVEVVSTSSGGSAKQDIDEIRFIAPKNYSAQGRTVTVDDFKSLLIKDFPEIDSISVWGGEDNIPPIYGKVFLAVKPKNGYSLSSTTKDYITQYLRKKSIVSIQPVFVDPAFTFVTVDSNIKYKSNLTVKDSATIAATARTAIQTFFANSLQQFDKKLYISKLQSAIDTIDPSIMGNTIVLGLQKRIEPIISLSSSYSLYFNNKITPYSVQSSAFNILYGTSTATVAIKDVPDTTPPDNNGTGTLVMFNVLNNTIIDKNVGTVNYATGFVNIKNLLVVGYPSTMIYDVRVNCSIQEQLTEISNSVSSQPSITATMPIPMQNQILMLDDSTAVSGYYVQNGLSVTATPI